MTFDTDKARAAGQSRSPAKRAACARNGAVKTERKTEAARQMGLANRKETVAVRRMVVIDDTNWQYAKEQEGGASRYVRGLIEADRAKGTKSE